jgi:hypothetical protein
MATGFREGGIDDGIFDDCLAHSIVFPDPLPPEDTRFPARNHSSPQGDLGFREHDRRSEVSVLAKIFFPIQVSECNPRHSP